MTIPLDTLRAACRMLDTQLAFSGPLNKEQAAYYAGMCTMFDALLSAHWEDAKSYIMRDGDTHHIIIGGVQVC